MRPWLQRHGIEHIHDILVANGATNVESVTYLTPTEIKILEELTPSDQNTLCKAIEHWKGSASEDETAYDVFISHRRMLFIV